MKQSGIVFNIQKYSVHDGPGIRTIVFLKGCPLRCRWCSNPESQQAAPQLVYNQNKCLTLENCVRCLEVCTVGAIKTGSENRVKIDREICNECLLCTRACPSLALNVYGETMTVQQVIGAVEEDSIFYSRSGGGLTLSGGEPMHQPEFALALLKEAKRRRINTAMETCGFCGWEALESACRYLDTLLYDLKTMDPEKHTKFTGVSNELILKNLGRVREAFPDLAIWIRTPIVPGINDSAQDIRPILEYIQGMRNVWFEALDYHRMGRPKYEYLGMEFPMGDEKLDELKSKQIRNLVRSEFAHLRPPGAPGNEQLPNAASDR